jgi:hypothetical protein
MLAASIIRAMIGLEDNHLYIRRRENQKSRQLLT